MFGVFAASHVDVAFACDCSLGRRWVVHFLFHKIAQQIDNKIKYKNRNKRFANGLGRIMPELEIIYNEFGLIFQRKALVSSVCLEK